MLFLTRSKIFFLAFLSLLTAADMAVAVELVDQRKVFQSRLTDAEYRIAVGAIKKVNAAMDIEREITVRADVQRTTYEFERSVSVNRAWSAVEDHLVAEKRLLFACDGLACGSSNSWANDIFEIKQLYGLDQSQKYRVYALKKQPNTFKIAYFVQRGNKRVYAQIDSVEALDKSLAIAPSASAIASQLANKGYYSISLNVDSEQSTIAFDEEEFDALVDVLRTKPLTKYYVVGHSYLSDELDKNRQQSEKYALALVEQLDAKRVRKNRFTTESVGNLAPDEEVPEERVTLVLTE